MCEVNMKKTGTALTEKVCNDVFLREDLKNQLGIDGERIDGEVCTIYDNEWSDIMRLILRHYERLLTMEIQKMPNRNINKELLISRRDLLTKLNT